MTSIDANQINARAEVEKILDNRFPSRFVYAPNYWQWFKHQKDHDLLPEEIRHCSTLLDLYNYLGVDIFSRNVYCDPERYWFGGLCEETVDGFNVSESVDYHGKDRVVNRVYSSPAGILDERLRYFYSESTLVQEKFLFSDYTKDFSIFMDFIASRSWDFSIAKFNAVSMQVGTGGLVIAGEFFSPLKMLHFAMNPVNTVYFLMEHPAEAMELIRLHQEAQLRCIDQAVKRGVRVVMAMDNLDTLFHTPEYVKDYSSEFYIRASEICHATGAKFFIHACGQQKDNLGIISSYGVDGLEGVASPPLGDVMLDEAMEHTGDNFIITGGISAMETRNLKPGEEIWRYVEELFCRMLPYRNRFIFSSSCNTSIDTSWETIKDFRNAWLEFRDMS
jgi:hypothetical protein